MKNLKILLSMFLSLAFGSLTMAQNNLGDTLLNVNYENGTTTSGIPGITATDAPATDAAYIVSPGANGSNYAIAHKVVDNDPNYFSDENYRSESDALAIKVARYLPGDLRRYEFSVLLKDWTPFNGSDITETNLFQLKMSNGLPIPLMIRTKRNNIDCRYGNMDGTNTVVNIVSDVRPYVNQWIHFRVDVYFTTDNTGYIKVYMKLPGESSFSLADEKLNRRTFTGTPGTNVGYLKWGVYVAPEGVTRIAYHDDIRIINLNPAPTATGIIWANSIPDANPAYLDGPYTIGTTTTNPANYPALADAYLHPNLKFKASQKIVYFDSTNPAPGTGDNIVGNPWSDFSRSTLAAAGGSTTPGPNGRYLLNGWANATSGNNPTTLDPTAYYEFYLEPRIGYKIDFSTIKFTVLRGNTTHPNTFTLRSSLDNFVSDIGTTVSISGTTTPTPISFDASSLQETSNPITFRLYAYGATATSGTITVGLNDFQFEGQVIPGTLAVSKYFLAAKMVNGILTVNWNPSDNDNSTYEIQTSKDGKNFVTVKTILATAKTQSYEITVPSQDLAALMAVPLLFGCIGLGSLSRSTKAMFVLLAVATTCFSLYACKKQQGTIANAKEVYLRIKTTNTDGKISYSNTILVKEG